ncbi:oxygen-regulated protein 1-like [Hoplias malabaricus]|uniref:oxygen-regulated protein 1-like n=1 Tax=Hoplias malabaricus TaxID=27720 RepID=UPI0034637644
MNEAPAGRRAPLQAQSPGSIHTLMTSRQPYISDPIASKRVCFYKSGDAQFSGLPVVINNRTFKTFEALLDSLSKRVPLPFGVRTITTPRGHTTVRSLDQLHHGQSYICSDKRTVKPIDLEQARRKPPPWYHARPISSRRFTRERQSPGPRSTRRARKNEHAALLHTPRRLVVFRNGDPEVKHTLLLQKRTTHSFEALLELVSEVMHFPVLKLHTPDGRRVDGLPALILCSGVLVAAGRESFRKRNYDIQKPSAPTWLPAKSVGRRHPVSRKKKTMTSSTKSRPFSPSSERYIVNQINNSFAGSAYDYPSNPTGSVEMEAGHLLGSVACMDGEGEGGIHMPTEDDIEKSFRVNQDGSMTVEMKVRLTIKEEETIHWTTTLSRSSVVGQMKTASESHPELGTNLSDNIPQNSEHMASEVFQNCPEEYSFPMENTEEMEAGGAEPIVRIEEPLQPLPSTPGWRKVQQKQSVGSTMKVTETEIHENMLGSYAYTEETSNGEMKQEHCMVRQCRSRPVPKPRSNLPTELNVTPSKLQSTTYQSSEILQLHDNGEEVHETLLHIYEQQTCQENFLANTQLCVQGMGTCTPAGCRPASTGTVFPASSEKTVHSSSQDLKSEPKASSTHGSLTTQEKVHTLHQENTPAKIKGKKSTISTPGTGIHKPSESGIISTTDPSKRRKPVRVIVKKNHIFQIPAPERKQNIDKTDLLKEVKKIRADIFSRVGPRRRAEHNHTKAVHKLLKRRNIQATRQGNIPALLHSPVQLKVQSSNELPAEKEQCKNEVNLVQANVSLTKLNESLVSPKKNLLHASTSKSTLTRQTSMHEERGFQRETRELSESISLPALHSSSSVFNKYVELWLQKSEPEPVLPTYMELQENIAFLTPEEVQATPGLSDMTCETLGARETFQENLPHASVDDNNTSSRVLMESSKLSMGNDHMPEMPDQRNPSEKTHLLNQPSVEKIPKNNTMTKVSLFNSQSADKTQLSTFVTCDKKPVPNPLSLNKLFESKKTCLSKSHVSSDTTKSSEVQQMIIPKGECGMFETSLCKSLGPIPDANAQVKPPAEKTVWLAEKPYTVKMAVRPDMRHVLEELCHSIQSLRDVTQHKRLSCLEKSNSMPDFSSHLASTFGSSSRVLLAFLSVMTLKDGLANLNACHQIQDNLSCSEALRMLQSLKEMAAIENEEQLRVSLNALQNSISVQLLQSWRGFQELSDVSRSHTVTPGSSRYGSDSGSSSEEEAIQGLMEDLGVPDRIREELAALCTQEESIRDNQEGGLENLSESLPGLKMNGFTESCLSEKTISFSDSVLEEDVNMYVKSVIEKAVKVHLEDCVTPDESVTNVLADAKKEIKVGTENQDNKFSQIKRTERDDCAFNTKMSDDMSAHESTSEEQQRGEEKAVEPARAAVRYTGNQDIDAKQQNNEKENEVTAERTEFERCNTKANEILENPKYHMVIDCDDRKEALKKVMDQKQSKEVRVTEKDHKSFKSQEEDKPSTSEDEKSNSVEEDNTCDEELMSFSEDHVSDKEENIAVTEQKDTIISSLSKCQTEHEESQTQSQGKTDSVEKHIQPFEMQVTLHTDHLQTNMKEDITQNNDTEEQPIIYETRTIYSEEEQMILEAPECYTVYQEHFAPNECSSEEAVEYEEQPLHFIGTKKKSVAELISNLDSVSQRASNILTDTNNRVLVHTGVPDVSGTDNLPVSQISIEQDTEEEISVHEKSDGEMPLRSISPQESLQMFKSTKLSHKDLSSEHPSSSLAFSYDSRSSSLAQDSEGNFQINRVKSIREMFLAKSNTRSQNGHRRLPSPNSDMSDYQAESSDSGGNRSQTSPVTSSGEDENSRLAIAKGFVKRTIERLYGRSNSNGTAPEDERHHSASHGQKKEAPGRTSVTTLASIHEARTRVKTDLSYFNATSSLDAFNEPTHCVTLSAQVGPESAVLIDKGRWLLCENQVIPESSPELQEPQWYGENDTIILINPEQDAVKEDVPYSLFCPASPHRIVPPTELEEPTACLGPKFTYFNLPNASDSELESEAQNTYSPQKREAQVTPVTESPKSCPEKNSILPAFNPPVLKRADNKVHPLLEIMTPPVVTQPGRGQSTQSEVTRRSTEPDILEMLFIFCGQHCPIL